MMRKIFLRILTISLLTFILTPFSSAYNSDDVINIFIDDMNTWTTVYTVPEGKDLYLEKVYIYDEHRSDYLQIRDNGGDVLIQIDGSLTEHDDLDIIIKDSLEVIESDKNDQFNLIWFLISEDETLDFHIQWTSNGWNKHIFDKEDIDFIYFREFIIFSFAIVFKFFSIITNRNLNIF